MKYLSRLTLVLILILSLVAVSTVACDSNDNYKVGAVLSLTGGASSLGIPEKNTVNMIVDQINANGGINGHELEVIIYDDESDSTKAATLANRLIEQDDVLAIVGPTTSGNSEAIIDIVTKAKIPLVSCAASAKIVNPVEDRYWVFKTPQTDQEAVTEIYTYMEDEGITKVALLTATSGFGVSGRDFLKSDAADYGIEVVAEQTFDEGDSSVESQLTVIKGTEAEAIISWAITSDTVIIAKDMKTLNMEIPLYASHGIANMEFITGAGDAANGVIFPAGKLLFVDQVPDSDPQKQVLVDYVADYETLYGEGTISTFGGHMYDALWIVVNALEQIDEDLDTAEARAAIRDAIEEDTIAFAGTGGVFTMSATNHLGMAAGSLGMIEIVDGEWTLAT